MAGKARSAAQRAAIAIHEKESAAKKAAGSKAGSKSAAKTAGSKSAVKKTASKTAATKTESPSAAKKGTPKPAAKKAASKAAAKGTALASRPPAKKSSARKTAGDAAAKKTTAKTTAGKTTAGKKAAGRNTTGGRTTLKRAPATKSAVKKSAGKRGGSRPSASITKAGKDPRGGLTAEGRKQFNEQTGSHLRPGVKGAADTPEKKQRKGSFLRRHYANPPGPVVKDGKPTRQALQAAAWGEPVPKTEADEKKLAEKGSKLLEESKQG